MVSEGVRKYQDKIVDGDIKMPDLKDLNAWRAVLYLHKLVGQDKDRYSGYGYGNLSMRLEKNSPPKNERSFVITGSQTGNLEHLTEDNYAIVLEYYPEKNLILTQKGKAIASSESMTHGMVYDLSDDARFVFHVHSPEIWLYRGELKIPSTDKKVEYGTPEMAEEVKRIYPEFMNKNIFAMDGHEDGIVSFGETAIKAGFVILDYLQKAKQLDRFLQKIQD
ncbi:MAG: class II aldolase/adducin family protein [Nanoarchaeota archaeon]